MLIGSAISATHNFRKNVLESSRNVSETYSWYIIIGLHLDLMLNWQQGINKSNADFVDVQTFIGGWRRIHKGIFLLCCKSWSQPMYHYIITDTYQTSWWIFDQDLTYAYQETQCIPRGIIWHQSICIRYSTRTGFSDLNILNSFKKYVWKLSYRWCFLTLPSSRWGSLRE